MCNEKLKKRAKFTEEGNYLKKDTERACERSQLPKVKFIFTDNFFPHKTVTVHILEREKELVATRYKSLYVNVSLSKYL